MEKRALLPTLQAEKRQKISGGIYHKMQVDFTYNSNHIEGSHLSHEQTRYLFDTSTVEGVVHVNDLFETVNHFRCFDRILDTVFEPLTEAYIKDLHRTLKGSVVAGDDAVIGDYKRYRNEIGAVTTTAPEAVPEQMQMLLQAVNQKSEMTLYDVAEFHARFEKIHPFYDGNGRIGRLLMLKLCLANEIVPFFINEENKYFYYLGLKEWQLEEKPYRLLDVFLSMQDDMKAVLDYFEIDYDKKEYSARELIEKARS